MKHRQNVNCMDNVPLMLLSFCFLYKRVASRSFNFMAYPCKPPWSVGRRGRGRGQIDRKLYTTGSEEMGHFVNQSFSLAGLFGTVPVRANTTNNAKKRLGGEHEQGQW
jgi:hypothetical protein